MSTTECPGCGLRQPASGAAPPPERGASGECWERYGELLARSYGHRAYRPVHQLVVDAYLCQHPGGGSRREVQSLALCLMTLCLFMDGRAEPPAGPELHARMARQRAAFHRLEPPPLTGLLTVADVLAAPDTAGHDRLARAWAQDVWGAWSAHHGTVRQWLAVALA